MGVFQRQYQDAGIIINEAVFNKHRHHGETGWRAVTLFSWHGQTRCLNFYTGVSYSRPLSSTQMDERRFICLGFFWHDTPTWQFQFKLLQTVSAQCKSRHMLLGQDVTCYFSLLYPCPGDKSVSFLSFWWVADCTIVVPTCQACLAQTLCCTCICLLLA